MPIYEYGCPKCGEFELRQSVNDPVLSRCPTCRSKVTKLISSPAFQLKGGGWYSDGYQKKAASSGGSGGGSGGDGGGSSSGSSD
jgi:putative FmdB family regulatory protein